MLADALLTGRTSAGTIMSMVYGYEVLSEDDPFIVLANEALRTVSSATCYPGSDILNEFSLLVNLPSWMPFSKHLRRTQRLSHDVREVPFAGAKEALVSSKF